MNSNRNLHRGQMATSTSPFSFFLLVLNNWAHSLIIWIYECAMMPRGSGEHRFQRPSSFFRGASPGMKHSILWSLVGSSLISQHISRQIIF